MKTFKKAPLALAVTALMAAPYALAEGYGGDHELETSLTSDFTNNIDVDLNHSSTTDKHFRVRVGVRDYHGNSYSGALVDSKQIIDDNGVVNVDTDNTARVGGNAGQGFSADDEVGAGMSGNIGINVAAGDNNAQANDAALSASDAARVFGQAEAYSAQSTTNGYVTNLNSPNDARMGGNALRNATGNIGVNIVAGVGNAQQNSLAASSNTNAGSARATAAGQQTTYNNHTENGGVIRMESGSAYVEHVSLAGGYYGGGHGTYEGTWNQTNDVYPEIWMGGDINEGHPSTTATYWGHLDFDDHSPSGNDGQFEGDESGTLKFVEAGVILLGGTASGFSKEWEDVTVGHSNTAVLGGNALRGASGNVGVNIAAGSGNMQRNSLSIASSTGGVNGGNGGGEF